MEFLFLRQRRPRCGFGSQAVAWPDGWKELAAGRSFWWCCVLGGCSMPEGRRLLPRFPVRPCFFSFFSLWSGGEGLACAAGDGVPAAVLEPDPSFRPLGRALLRLSKPWMAMAFSGVLLPSVAAEEERWRRTAAKRPWLEMTLGENRDPTGLCCNFLVSGVVFASVLGQLCWKCPGVYVRVCMTCL